MILTLQRYQENNADVGARQQIPQNLSGSLEGCSGKQPSAANGAPLPRLSKAAHRVVVGQLCAPLLKLGGPSKHLILPIEDDVHPNEFKLVRIIFCDDKSSQQFERGTTDGLRKLRVCPSCKVLRMAERNTCSECESPELKAHQFTDMAGADPAGVEEDTQVVDQASDVLYAPIENRQQRSPFATQQFTSEYFPPEPSNNATIGLVNSPIHERNLINTGASWFCCSCGDGPNLSINAACSSCGHCSCSSCYQN